MFVRRIDKELESCFSPFIAHVKVDEHLWLEFKLLKPEEENPNDVMTITGIPPHFLALHSFKELEIGFSREFVF